MSKHTQDYEPRREATTIHLEPFLMPVAVVLASCILSFSMVASFWKLGSSMENSSNADVKGVEIEEDSNAIIPTEDYVPEPTTAVTSLDDDSVKGEKNAKVAIVEFSDYQCPYCKKFYDETLNQIQKEFIDSGKVAFVFRDLPLSFHPFAQVQAEAAECAGEQGKYFEMHNYIFDKGGELDASQLKTAAQAIGLDTNKFNSCLDEGKMKAETEKDAQDAADIGIGGTPGFVVGTLSDDGTVDGTIISGAYPYETFKETIEQYL